MEKNNEMNSGRLLEVENLFVTYTSRGEVVHAVNGVSFTLDKGKVLGLVGETGAGKTSIAKAIMRILPDPPAKVPGGSVYLDGQNLYDLSDRQMQKIRGKKVSMIFQDPMTALNPVMTVGEQIEEALLLHEKINKADAAAKAKEILELVGIPGARSREYPHQFSGGMKQRCVIAIALACNPELILADEPTTALDVTIQAQVLDMIRELRDKFNTAMILITHDLGVVASICDEVAIVYAGEIVEKGSLEDIFDRPCHPYTTGLFGTIPKLTGDEKRLNTIPGMPPNPAQLPEGCNFNPRCEYACDACRSGEIGLYEVTPGHFCRCCNLDKVMEKEA